jgi:hypothetical protein
MHAVSAWLLRKSGIGESDGPDLFAFFERWTK